MRKLATIRRVLELSPIEGADNIEVALVDGWRTVVKKGEFKVGELAVYFEIDSWIPKAVAPFLCKGKIYNEVEGARLQTVRLRGQISQGLLLPLSVIPTFPVVFSPKDEIAIISTDNPEIEGVDVTEVLGVQLWEPPPPKQGSFNPGRHGGNFPAFLRKTDQERVQNLRGALAQWADEEWEVTEKLDGTSFTAFHYEGRKGVCSRNFELKAESDVGCFPGLYWQIANETGILDLISDGFAVQGEIIGPGIQGNKYKRTAPELWIFDVFDIRLQRYLPMEERIFWLGRNGLNASINHVPLLQVLKTPVSIDAALAYAEGQSLLADVEREGVVFKHISRPWSWKAISNTWLLAHKA